VRRIAQVLAVAVVACATDTLVFDIPRAVDGLAIAPYEFHEECAQLGVGDRIDYRFEAKTPVLFEIYYKEGITFVATVSRDNATEYAGVFQVRSPQRYCLRWEAGPRGALIDFRIRVLRPAGAS
jgi:hypothetical protein